MTDNTATASPPEPTLDEQKVLDERASTSRTANLLRSKLLVSSGTFLAFIAVLVLMSIWLGGLFLNVDSRLLDVHQNVPVLLLGLAFMMGLVAGAFDLSIASMATLTTYLTIGLTVNQDWSFWLVLPFALVVGLIGGLLNAFLVVTLRINALIATLGTGGVFLGLSRVYGGGTQLSPTPDSPQLPVWFSGGESFGSFQTKVPEALTWTVLAILLVWGTVTLLRRAPTDWTITRWRGLVLSAAAVTVAVVVIFLQGLIAALPWTIAFLFVVSFVLWLLLRYTTLGRYLYATGGNSEAARLAGINVDRMTVVTFCIVGVLSALAGIVLAANQGSASPGVAQGFLLPAVAIAFLSTVLLSSGRFHVWGTVLGGIFIVAVRQGLIVGGVPFTWTEVLNGAVLIVAVGLSSVLRRFTR